MSSDAPTITIIFNRETCELNFQASQMPLDFALSMLHRATRFLEAQEKIVNAQNMAVSLQQAQMDARRAESVMSRIKM